MSKDKQDLMYKADVTREVKELVERLAHGGGVYQSVVDSEQSSFAQPPRPAKSDYTTDEVGKFIRDRVKEGQEENFQEAFKGSDVYFLTTHHLARKLLEMIASKDNVSADFLSEDLGLKVEEVMEVLRKVRQRGWLLNKDFDEFSPLALSVAGDDALARLRVAVPPR